MNEREVAGVRKAIEWLHKRAEEMNDAHAKGLLDSAAFNLGLQLKRWRGDLPMLIEVEEMNHKMQDRKVTIL